MRLHCMVASPPTMKPAKKRLKTTDVSPLSIFDIVAENGWCIWHSTVSDHSKLRLVSRKMKMVVDQPHRGGPDFPAIVQLLNDRNRFDLDEGHCDHCHVNQDKWNSGMSFCSSTGRWEEVPPQVPVDEQCRTCAASKGDYQLDCTCKERHRYGPVVLDKDPRLSSDQPFDDLSPREQAGRLLKFHRWCVSNFLTQEYGEEQDLTLAETKMLYGGMRLMGELDQYNHRLCNFIHHLLFIGWAHKDLSLSACAPGTFSPYRECFLGGESAPWDGGHRDTFTDITECFLGIHTPKKYEQAFISPFSRETYSVSQIQYLPETIRRCVENTVDNEAVDLLGERIAASIDIYRLVRETYDNDEEDLLKSVDWMPCFGEDDFQHEKSDYNPRATHIDCTGLLVCPYEGDVSAD